MKLRQRVCSATQHKLPSNYDKKAAFVCIRPTVVMQRGTYESSNPATQGGGGGAEGGVGVTARRLQPLLSRRSPTTRAICYFTLSATRSLIKCPPRVSFVRGIFQAQATTYDMPRLAAAVLHFFQLPSPTFDLSFASRPINLQPSAPRIALRIQTFQDGPTANPRAMGFRKRLLVLSGNSLLCERKFVSLRSANTVLQGGIL